MLLQLQKLLACNSERHQQIFNIFLMLLNSCKKHKICLKENSLKNAVNMF